MPESLGRMLYWLSRSFPGSQALPHNAMVRLVPDVMPASHHHPLSPPVEGGDLETLSPGGRGEGEGEYEIKSWDLVKQSQGTRNSNKLYPAPRSIVCCSP